MACETQTQIGNFARQCCYANLSHYYSETIGQLQMGAAYDKCLRFWLYQHDTASEVERHLQPFEKLSRCRFHVLGHHLRCCYYMPVSPPG